MVIYSLFCLLILELDSLLNISRVQHGASLYWRMEALDFLHLSATQILQLPALVTVVISATRMYRSLSDFAARSGNTYEILHLLSLPCSQGFRTSNGVTSKIRWASAVSVPFTRTVNTVVEPHPVPIPQTNSHSSGLKPDGEDEVYERPTDLHLYDKAECGI